MPIIRLNRTDEFAIATTTASDMGLEFTGFDGLAATFAWTGRGYLVPLAAIAKVVNPNTRDRMFRSVWIAADAAETGFWVVGDTFAILSSRLGERAAMDFDQKINRLPVCGPYDRIAIKVGSKASAYSIDLMINTLDEGDSRSPELPVPTSV